MKSIDAAMLKKCCVLQKYCELKDVAAKKGLQLLHMTTATYLKVII
jgi:hypothetical protein